VKKAKSALGNILTLGNRRKLFWLKPITVMWLTISAIMSVKYKLCWRYRREEGNVSYSASGRPISKKMLAEETEVEEEMYRLSLRNRRSENVKLHSETSKEG